MLIRSAVFLVYMSEWEGSSSGRWTVTGGIFWYVKSYSARSIPLLCSLCLSESWMLKLKTKTSWMLHTPAEGAHYSALSMVCECQWKVRIIQPIENGNFSRALTQIFFTMDRGELNQQRDGWSEEGTENQRRRQLTQQPWKPSREKTSEWVKEKKRQTQSSTVKESGLEGFVHTTKGRDWKKEKAGWDVSDDLNVLFLPSCSVLMSVLWFVSPWRSHRCRSKCCLSIKGALWKRLAVSPEIHVVSPQWFNLVSTFPLPLSA